MEFKKVNNEFEIVINGDVVGRIYKDEKKNYQFNHVVELYFEIKGYVNSAAEKNWKRAKAKAEQLYNNLIEINKKYGHEIMSK